MALKADIRFPIITLSLDNWANHGIWKYIYHVFLFSH